MIPSVLIPLRIYMIVNYYRRISIICIYGVDLHFNTLKEKRNAPLIFFKFLPNFVKSNVCV